MQPLNSLRRSAGNKASAGPPSRQVGGWRGGGAGTGGNRTNGSKIDCPAEIGDEGHLGAGIAMGAGDIGRLPGDCCCCCCCYGRRAGEGEEVSRAVRR